jgi:hypothetical protein
MLEIALLAAGALAARGFVRRVGRGERKVVVLASMAAWLVLFGMIPFFAFAVFLPAGGRGQAGPFEALVLNVVPFALAVSPLVGLVQALALTGRRGHERL